MNMWIRETHREFAPDMPCLAPTRSTRVLLGPRPFWALVYACQVNEMKCVRVCVCSHGWRREREMGMGREPQKRSSQGRGALAHPTFGQTCDELRRRRDIRCILPCCMLEAFSFRRRRAPSARRGRGRRCQWNDATGGGAASGGRAGLKAEERLRPARRQQSRRGLWHGYPRQPMPAPTANPQATTHQLYVLRSLRSPNLLPVKKIRL